MYTIWPSESSNTPKARDLSDLTTEQAEYHITLVQSIKPHAGIHISIISSSSGHRFIYRGETLTINANNEKILRDLATGPISRISIPPATSAGKHTKFFIPDLATDTAEWKVIYMSNHVEKWGKGVGGQIWSLDRVTWWGLERFEKSEMSWGETEQSSWLSTFGCLRACRNRNQKSCREKHGFHLWVCRWNPYVFHLFSDFYQKACPDDVFHSFSDSHQKIVTRSKTQLSLVVLVGRERVEWPDILDFQSEWEIERERERARERYDELYFYLGGLRFYKITAVK